MLKHKRRYVMVLTLLALTGIAAVVARGVPVGQVLVSVGEVVAVSEGKESRSIGRGDQVRTGETIRVGSDARTQIRLRDGALIALKPNSRFRIERYTKQSDDGGEAVMRLIEGGLRTITGAIGTTSKGTYRMETPAATIGIRGTQYSLRFCDSDCGPEAAESLFGRVDEGRIHVANDAGEAVFGPDTYFRVASREDAPQRIEQPPPGVLGNNGVESNDGWRDDAPEEPDFSTGDDRGGELEKDAAEETEETHSPPL